MTKIENLFYNIVDLQKSVYLKVLWNVKIKNYVRRILSV